MVGWEEISDYKSTEILLFWKGKTPFIPYFQRQLPDMEMVSLLSEHDYNALPRNSWGIPTPAQSSIPTRKNCFDQDADEPGLDLVIVPGVAFDNECRRLGHGKGYYDRFIERYSKTFDGKIPLLGTSVSTEKVWMC